MIISIIVERIWEMENGLKIVKTCKGDENYKKIPNTSIYSVEDEESTLNCFRTLAEARRYAKDFY